MENSSRKKKGLEKSCGARRGTASRAAACPRPRAPSPVSARAQPPPAPGRAEPLLPGPAGSAPSSPVPPGEPHAPCGTRCARGRTLETLLNPSWPMAVMKARVSSKRLATSATSRVPLRERLRCEGWHCKTPRPPPSLPAITHLCPWGSPPHPAPAARASLPTPVSAHDLPLPGSPAGWCPSALGRKPQHPLTQLPKAPMKHQHSDQPQREDGNRDGQLVPLSGTPTALRFTRAPSLWEEQPAVPPYENKHTLLFTHRVLIPPIGAPNHLLLSPTT